MLLFHDGTKGAAPKAAPCTGKFLFLTKFQRQKNLLLGDAQRLIDGAVRIWHIAHAAYGEIAVFKDTTAIDPVEHSADRLFKVGAVILIPCGNQEHSAGELHDFIWSSVFFGDLVPDSQYPYRSVDIPVLMPQKVKGLENMLFQ